MEYKSKNVKPTLYHLIFTCLFVNRVCLVVSLSQMMSFCQRESKSGQRSYLYFLIYMGVFLLTNLNYFLAVGNVQYWGTNSSHTNTQSHTHPNIPPLWLPSADTFPFRLNIFFEKNLLTCFFFRLSITDPSRSGPRVRSSMWSSTPDPATSGCPPSSAPSGSLPAVRIFVTGVLSSPTSLSYRQSGGINLKEHN